MTDQPSVDPLAAAIRHRVSAVRARIAAAAQAVGRDAQSVCLIAAAKSRTPDEIAAAIDAGVDAIGMNYVQEGLAVRAEVAARGANVVPWRLIGHLQRNKARAALDGFDAIDTVDSERLARTLGRVAGEAGRTVEVLLQIRLGDEAGKSGVAPTEAARLLAVVQQTEGLVCHGLMTIPPPAAAGEPVDTMRGWFGQLRELAEALRRQSGLTLPVLSMGMSDDFEPAIQEGATHVRVGTALFGPRPR